MTHESSSISYAAYRIHLDWFLFFRKFEISVEHGSLISRESIDNGSWIFNFGILQDIFLPPSNRICSDDSLNHSKLAMWFDNI